MSLADADFLCTAFALSSEKSDGPEIVSALQNEDASGPFSNVDKPTLKQTRSKASLISRAGSLISVPAFSNETLKKVESPRFVTADNLVSRDYVVNFMRLQRLRHQKMKKEAQTQPQRGGGQPTPAKTEKNSSVYITRKLKSFQHRRIASNKASVLSKPGATKVAFTPTGKRKVAAPSHQRRQTRLLQQ